MTLKHLIAITGGIGSGKSIVCKILRAKGYKVFDCDSEASKIMACDKMMHEKLNKYICSDAVLDGVVNRKKIAEVVFNDADALQRLNNIVHNAVKDKLLEWRGQCNDCLLFVETAILYQSGIDKLVQEVWEVNAPINLRVERVMLRNSISSEQVIARIKSQEYTPDTPHINTQTIKNDDKHAVLPQINRLLQNCRCRQ